MSSQRRQLARVLAKPALSLAAVALALGLAEVAVRVSGRVPAVKPIRVSDEGLAYRRSDNPILSYELRPNYRNDAPDLLQNYERTNAHGQRDRERTLDKPVGVRRVLLLGDSVVEGAGVRETETISRQLESRYPEGTVEVLNFGVSGYCTRAEVELLETKGLAFRPDEVILLFVENDFENFNAEAFLLGAEVRRPSWAQALFLRSEAFRLAALQLDLYGFGAEQDPVGHNNRAIGANNVVGGLHRLRELAERDGFRTLVAIWPRFENDRIVDLPPMPGDPTALVIERLAAMYGFPTLRLSVQFRADAAGPGAVNPRLAYTIGDRMHPSPRGCGVAAEALQVALERPQYRDAPAADRLDRGIEDDPAAVEAARALSSRGEPNYARVYTRIGNDEQLAGRLAEAIALYEKALLEDPDWVNAHVNLGHALRKSGRPVEAAGHYRAALRSDPHVGGVRVELGLLLEAQGRPDDARALYEEQLSRKPGDAQAHLKLGNLAIKQGRLREAVQHYEASLSAASDVAETHNNLGLAHEQLGDLERAAEHYEAALGNDPSLVDTHINLGIVRAQQGDDAGALASFTEALRLDPARPAARSNLATLLERLGRRGEAAEHLREGLRLAEQRGDAPAARRFTEKLRRLGGG